MIDTFSESSSVFEEQLREIFKPISNKDQSSLFSVLSIVLYSNSKLTELHDVYDLLGLDNFVKLVSLLDGRQVRFPSTPELKDSVILALCFYYREIEHKEWDDIRLLVPYEFNAISMAYKIKALNKMLYTELKSVLELDKQKSKEKKSEF